MLRNLLNTHKIPLYLSAMILLFLALFSVTVFAQLEPAEREELKTLLLKARDVNSALQGRLLCYTEKDAVFQAQSSQLQQQTGDLHQQEKQLASELARVKSEAEGFRQQLLLARQQLEQLQARMQQVEWEIRSRQAELDRCKDDWGFVGFLCDLAGEITGLNGQLRQLAAERQSHELTTRMLEPQVQAAQNRQIQAEQHWYEAQSKTEQTQAAVLATEAKITVLKASLEQIRLLRQQYATSQDSLSHSFAEFESLDPASDRRSVIRRLRQESAALNELLLKAHTLLDKNGLSLPGGERICAV